jgi:LasA protease
MGLSNSKPAALRIGMFGATLLFAGLACARADVPAPLNSGAAGLNSLAVPSQTSTKAPTLVPQATATPPPATPTATLTPATPEAVASPTLPATPTADLALSSQPILYQAQPGDTIRTLAIRFGVIPEDIRSASGALPGPGQMLTPGQVLIIPQRLSATGPSDLLIPDSEMVFSPPASGFDVVAFVNQQDGFLTSYQEYVGNRWRTGGEVVALAARDNSVNPRLLLALLEDAAGWVTHPDHPTGDALTYPMGYVDRQTTGLYRQLTWLANELGQGYYSWRAGTLTELTFSDGSRLRLAPQLNAGTVGLQAYFARTLRGQAWVEKVSPSGFIVTYQTLFGDPWQYFHPLFEPGMKQPELILPFISGHIWAFTGGPHGAWEREAAWAALDFAPPSTQAGCVPSDEWVLAAAPGLVVRSGGGVVVLDLDGDGNEQTGWVVLYLHIATKGAVSQGTRAEQGDLIGHPSCEGGIATGTHVHIARKYNGEWILADGPLPFEMSGWIAHAGIKAYQGELVKDGQMVIACTCASKETWISR